MFPINQAAETVASFCGVRSYSYMEEAEERVLWVDMRWLLPEVCPLRRHTFWQLAGI